MYEAGKMAKVNLDASQSKMKHLTAVLTAGRLAQVIRYATSVCEYTWHVNGCDKIVLVF